ncbi:hypothetical protein Igag_1642 [Ignisphaera aggregans DSM 17230]|uniref:Uncharacterized protein n=1 Tax=Ignisphaera aggregans (strain DSM 17230 / JCM 13409 / AQ1.S1) TaxID=583356 RepID=E0SRQ9_IGNAA|nr:hypothetical protein Igag_1642 [Ignisphaera aggregans DSM 17230]
MNKMITLFSRRINTRLYYHNAIHCIVSRMRILAILIIIMLMISTINICCGELYAEKIEQALFSVANNTKLYTLLRDIKTSQESQENIELILVNGIPKIFSIENADFYKRIYLSLYLNKTPIENIANRYTVLYTGYSISSKLSINSNTLSIYTYVLYGYRAFYTTICLSSYIPTTNLSIVINIGNRYEYIVERGIQNIINLLIDNISYNLAILSQYQLNIDTINISSLSIEIPLISGRCIDILFVISRDSIDNGYLLDIYRNTDSLAKESQSFFLEILSGYPDIDTNNIAVDNLYRYVVYSLINIVYGYPGNDLCMRSLVETIAIIDFAKIARDYGYIVSNLAKCININKEMSIDDMVKALYLYANAIHSNITLENIDIVIEGIERYIDNVANNDIYDVIELVLLRKVLSMFVESYGYAPSSINTILSNIDSILRNTMYYQGHYILRWNRGVIEDINQSNIFRALSIAIADLPDIDRHVTYVVNYMNYLLYTDRIFYEDPYSWISIAILLRYGYLYTATKLLLQYINNIDFARDTISLSPLSIFIYGLLGLDIGIYSLSIYPSIPREMANTNLTLYICGRQIPMYIVGWGLEPKNIFLDNTPIYGYIIPLNDICRTQIDRIIVFMEIPKTIETIVRVSIGGSLGRGIVVTAISNMYSISTVTDGFGEARLELPIDSDVWLYIRYVYGDFVLKIHTPDEGRRWYVEISIPFSDIDIDSLRRAIQNNTMAISRVESRVLDLEERVRAIESSIANMSSSTLGSNVSNVNYINTVVLIASFTSLLLSITLFILVLRKIYR